MVISPQDGTTISIADAVERISGQTYFRDIVVRLRPYAPRTQWPQWIPNDEEARLEDDGEPTDIDQRLWTEIREAFLGVFNVEDDQIYFDLEVSRLEADSLDWVALVMDIEERLVIEVNDSDIAPFADGRNDAHSIGDVYRVIEALV